jgi:hypothetical protein
VAGPDNLNKPKHTRLNVTQQFNGRPPVTTQFQLINIIIISSNMMSVTVVCPGILFERDSAGSVEDRGQRERGSEDGSPLVRGSAQFANE